MVQRFTRLLAFVSCLAIASPAFADVQPSPAPGTSDLKLSPALDGTLLGIGLIGTLVPELGKSAWAPKQCRWCESDDSGVTVNAFDRAFRNTFVGAASVTPPTWARVSDVMMLGVLPLSALSLDFFVTHDHQFNKAFGTDIGIVTESVLLAAALNQTVKFIAGRQRPFVAYNSPFAPGLRHGNETVADDNLSFYSGHSSAAMATTVGMARVIQLRTGKMIGYYTLVPLGLLTAFMRLGADKHWATDVLTGVAVGSVAGFVIPTLHRE
jgi:membrane-associated phospholipid phosphatase